MKSFTESLRRIGKKGLIPVVVIEDPRKAISLGKAFLDADLDVIEITMRTQRAIEALKILRQELPEILVGAGTVFSLMMARESLDAGACFIVTPCFDEGIIKYCVKNEVMVCSGAYTPTEVNMALQSAIKAEDNYTNVENLPLVVKIFPASSGGPEHIKALKAIFPYLKFVPTGGINAANLADYVKAGAWAIGGTWICRKELIDKGEMTKISELTREALQIIKQTRQKIEYSNFSHAFVGIEGDRRLKREKKVR